MAAKPNTCAVVVMRLAGIALQIPPAAYVAWTGTAPDWARIWLTAFVGLWLLITVVSAALPKN